MISNVYDLVTPSPVELTKSSAELVARDMTAAVHDGEIQPLRAYIRLSFIKAAIEAAIADIKELALDEAEQHAEKSFTAENGVKVDIRETGVKYDYSGDAEWRELKDNADAINAALKGREKTLQLAKIAPKTSTTSVVLTFPK